MTTSPPKRGKDVGWRFLVAIPCMAITSWWICTGLIGQQEVENQQLDEDCQRYIEKALPRILRSWNFDEWKLRATAELQASVNMKRLQRDYKGYRTLFGEFRRVSRPVGKIMVDNSGGVPETLGIYSVSCRFEKGNADIAMKLVKRRGGWKFQQFMLRSDMVVTDD